MTVNAYYHHPQALSLIGLYSLIHCVLLFFFDLTLAQKKLIASVFKGHLISKGREPGDEVTLYMHSWLCR